MSLNFRELIEVIKDENRIKHKIIFILIKYVKSFNLVFQI